MGSGLKSIGRKGISPLIASVLSIMLGVMMLAVVLTVIQPTFRGARDSSIISDIFQNLKLMDSAIKEVSSEAEGSKRTISITVSGGEYRLNSTYDWLYATYIPESELVLSGRRGDMRIDAGLVYAEYFNWFPEGSTGSPEWTNTSGQWSVSSLKYLGTNGTSYMNITPRPIERFRFSGSMANVSGPTGGQIFVLPTGLEGLKGFWTFDNRSGDTAYDFSGNQNGGTLQNMDTAGSSTSGWQNASDCKAGGSCLVFDGSNDDVNISDSPELRLVDNFAVEFWMKPYDLTSTNDYILCKCKDIGNNDWAVIWEWVDNSVEFFAQGYTGSDPRTNSAITIPDTDWHHIVYSYDGSTWEGYRDGVQVFSVQRTFALEADSTTWLTIGSPFSLATYFYKGMLDEVRVWGTSLTSEEVSAAYELSTKKLSATGSQNIDAKTYGTLVLSNPAGQTQFDDVKITRGDNIMSFLVPYNRVDLNGTLKLQKGEYLVEITHAGINSTLNKPIIELTTS